MAFRDRGLLRLLFYRLKLLLGLQLGLVEGAKISFLRYFFALGFPRSLVVIYVTILGLISLLLLGQSHIEKEVSSHLQVGVQA